MRGAMAEIAKWIFFPSFVLTLIAGLLAIAVNRAYHNVGWAWVKLATGILVFAGSLHALSPIQEEKQQRACRPVRPRYDHRNVWSRARDAVDAPGGLDSQCRARRLAATPHPNTPTPEDRSASIMIGKLVLGRPMLAKGVRAG
jgi:hypothetical protein